MKNIIIAFILIAFITPACKKEAGIGGKKTIEGTVHFLNGATGALEIAGGASVMIVYGESSYNSTYDQTVQTDVNGHYHFDGLQKGEYFVNAEYTDQHGFKYVTNGTAVKIEKKKGTLTVNMDLE